MDGKKRHFHSDGLFNATTTTVICYMVKQEKFPFLTSPFQASPKQDGEGRNAGVTTRSLAATYALITLALAILAWI